MKENIELNSKLKAAMSFIENVAKKYIQRKKQIELEDVVQEVLIRLLKQSHILTRDTNIMFSWLNVTTYNYCMSILRKKQPITYSLDLAGETYLSVNENISLPIQVKTEGIRDFELIKSASFVLSTLSDRQRQVLILIGLGCNYKEIAVMTQSKANTVKSTIFYARKNFTTRFRRHTSR